MINNYYEAPPSGGLGNSAGGNTVSGPNVYNLTNRKCPCENEGEKVLHTGGGKCTGDTVRENCNNCDLDNYEAKLNI